MEAWDDPVEARDAEDTQKRAQALTEQIQDYRFRKVAEPDRYRK